MKYTTIALWGAIAALGSARAATISTSSDLLFTVGSGANQAALVIDFNDGTASESFAWGYRWDGTASGAGMILAIAAADPNLQITSDGTAAGGFFISAISYFDGSIQHQGVNDFSSDPSSGFGYYLAGGTAGGDAVAGGGAALPSSWSEAPVGASETSFGSEGRLLSDGAWDAWSFGEYDATFSHLDSPGPEAPTAAVPEPGVTWLGLASLGMLLRRRDRRAS